MLVKPDYLLTACMTLAESFYYEIYIPLKTSLSIALFSVVQSGNYLWKTSLESIAKR